jgi:hypothetical protein
VSQTRRWNRPPRPAESERGFVLVGVVMFVLALTILGFALFDLSGYEAKFSQDDLNSEAAFFSACGGIDRAKFVLAKTESLGAVGDVSLSPDPNVIYARAWRTDIPDDTLESIENMPAGTPVQIRVLANVNGTKRCVQTNYIPFQAKNLYKRLMTVREGVFVRDSVDTNGDNVFDAQSCSPLHVVLGGDVATSGLMVGCAYAFNPPYALKPEANLPLPDIATFFSQYWNVATPVGQTGWKYHLMNGYTIPGGPSDVQFFKTNQDNNDGLHANYFSVASENKVEIDVQGTAIWLLDHGLRFDQEVSVKGTSNDCLVIVTRPNGRLFNDPTDGKDYHDLGIWFFGGMGVQDVPMILVTDGEARLEHKNNYDANSHVDYLSVFAKNAWLKGPFSYPDDPPIHTMSLNHPNNAPFDAADGRIDKLCEIGALPNSDTGGMRFTRVAGTWKELDPDNRPLY